ncbi:MAG TPA: hypothetical protein VKB16_02760 [Beijerinckiaceae bacterium]|jgi:hypothetical protein|nr:hypothetical protein [Beijerinckiaceae bacterium]
MKRPLPNPPPITETASPRATEGRVPLSGLESAPEIAAYIGQMSADLAVLARSAKLGALAYLLEMTQIEAGHPIQKTK